VSFSFAHLSDSQRMEASSESQLRELVEKLKQERDEAVALAKKLEQENSSLKVGKNELVKSSSTHKLAKRLSIKSILHTPTEGTELIGQVITIAGWARTIRKQGGGRFTFLELNDGSCAANFQVVVRAEIPGFDDVSGPNAGTGACIMAIGKVVQNKGTKQAVEMLADSVELLGACVPGDYPLAKTKLRLETLRSIAHLRPRTNTFGAVARIRNACAFATHRFFQEQGFVYVHTPLITASDCEGAGEMFQVTTLLNGSPKPSELPVIKETGKVDYTKDFFGKPSYLTVSGQLNGEMYATALGKVYTFGPTFRAENSHTTRHIAEFWMIEPEIAFADLNDNMDTAESYLKFVLKYVLENHREDLEVFEKLEQFQKKEKEEEAKKEQAEKAKSQKKDKSKKQGEKKQEEKKQEEKKPATEERPLIPRLEHVLATPFRRVTYTEAVEILLKVTDKQFETKVEWGIDLQSEHERYLTEEVFKQPIILTDYPKEIKAFYMRLNEDEKTVRAMDVLVPKIGEIIGGSQREERLDVLEKRIEDLKLDKEAYRYYLDLRRYGTVMHSGFGLGFERLIMFVTGLENIRDAIPFPRWPGHAEF